MGAWSRALSAGRPSFRSATAPTPSRLRTASPWASASRPAASPSGPRAISSSIVFGKPPRPWRTVPRSRARSAASAPRSSNASPTMAPTRGFDDPLRNVTRCTSRLDALPHRRALRERHAALLGHALELLRDREPNVLFHDVHLADAHLAAAQRGHGLRHEHLRRGSAGGDADARRARQPFRSGV